MSASSQHMIGSTHIEPECPEIVIHIGDLENDDLALINRVTQALATGGHLLMADAFAAVAVTTQTWDELMLLVRCTVSVN